MRIRLIFLIVIISGLSALLFVIPNFYYPIAEVTVISGEPNIVPGNNANSKIEIQSSLPYILSYFFQIFNIDSLQLWIFELSWSLQGIMAAIFGIFTSGCILFLYSRRKLSKNPESRSMKILAYITDNPGVQQKDIIQATGYSRGSVSHHLRYLMQNIKIYKINDDVVRYYSIGIVPSEKNNHALKLLENETRKRIFQTIFKNPGIPQKHIADEIHIPVTTLRWHLGKMLREKIILVDNNHHITRYSINPAVVDETISHMLDSAQYL